MQGIFPPQLSGVLSKNIDPTQNLLTILTISSDLLIPLQTKPA
jgi:hypothetical protein